jgi:chromosome transmission fidelity protein 1
MSPISDFVEQLLPSVPTSELEVFSCGHVIPNEQLLPICLSAGPTNVPFNFTFEKRNKESLVKEMGLAIVNLSNVVPGGIVVFFASYSYMDQVFAKWENSGSLI